jgi:carbon starvation protein CstA
MFHFPHYRTHKEKFFSVHEGGHSWCTIVKGHKCVSRSTLFSFIVVVIIIIIIIVVVVVVVIRAYEKYGKWWCFS